MSIYHYRGKICNIICFLLFSLTANYAHAQKVESIHKDWTVLTTVINSNKVCYMASLPTIQEGNSKARKDTYILINKFPERDPEISFTPGFTLQTERDIKIDVEGTEYLLTKIQDNMAWTKTAQEDAEIIMAMKKGVELYLRSEGQDGTYAIDTYSLRGFTAAYDRMIDLCTMASEQNQEIQQQ